MELIMKAKINKKDQSFKFRLYSKPNKAILKTKRHSQNLITKIQMLSGGNFS